MKRNPNYTGPSKSDEFSLEDREKEAQEISRSENLSLINPRYNPETNLDGKFADVWQDLTDTVATDRLGESVEVCFLTLLHVTQPNYTKKGALLFALQFPDAEETDIQEVWIPKTLCKNLDFERGTVMVWQRFLQNKYPELI